MLVSSVNSLMPIAWSASAHRKTFTGSLMHNHRYGTLITRICFFRLLSLIMAVGHFATGQKPSFLSVAGIVELSTASFLHAFKTC